MPRSQPAQHVLEYASGISPDDGVVWRENGTGTWEFLVKPPPLARLLIGPILFVIGTTPGFAMVLLFAIRIIRSGYANAIPIVSLAILTLLIGYGWLGGVRKLIQVARRGRIPFILCITRAGIHISGASESNTAFDTRPVVELYLREAGHLLHRAAYLRITFAGNRNKPRGFHIPWPTRAPLDGWENVLRNALVVKERPPT
jgi:hypothetical protein